MAAELGRLARLDHAIDEGGREVGAEHALDLLLGPLLADELPNDHEYLQGAEAQHRPEHGNPKAELDPKEGGQAQIGQRQSECINTLLVKFTLWEKHQADYSEAKSTQQNRPGGALFRIVFLKDVVQDVGVDKHERSCGINWGRTKIG